MCYNGTIYLRQNAPEDVYNIEVVEASVQYEDGEIHPANPDWLGAGGIVVRSQPGIERYEIWTRSSRAVVKERVLEMMVDVLDSTETIAVSYTADGNRWAVLEDIVLGEERELADRDNPVGKTVTGGSWNRYRQITAVFPSDATSVRVLFKDGSGVVQGITEFPTSTSDTDGRVPFAWTASSRAA